MSDRPRLRALPGSGEVLRLVTAATVRDFRAEVRRAEERERDPARRARLRETAAEVEERFVRSELGGGPRLEVVR